MTRRDKQFENLNDKWSHYVFALGFERFIRLNKSFELFDGYKHNSGVFYTLRESTEELTGLLIGVRAHKSRPATFSEYVYAIGEETRKRFERLGVTVYRKEIDFHLDENGPEGELSLIIPSSLEVVARRKLQRFPST
jgi:hypothetical protein